MFDYQLLFHVPGSKTDAESISAADDGEARALAELRLLMTDGVAGVSVMKNGVQIIALDRDVRYGGMPPTGPDPTLHRWATLDSGDHA